MKKLLTLSLMVAAHIAATAQTKLQVIHNCADAAADSVDVYLGSTLLLDNFAFRTATPFIDAPTGTPLVLGVAPKNSSSVTDTFYTVTVTLDATKKYVVVANGIESPTGYTPSATAVPFRLSVYDMARQVSTTAGNTDILVAHGSTDAPIVDVKAGTSTLVNDIAFGQFCSTGYVSVPEADYVLDITPGASSAIVKRYSAPLAALNLGDSAITVVASGFLDSTVNSNGKSFGLWVALQQGGSLIPLPSLAVPTAVSNTIATNNVQLFPNPATDMLNISATDVATISIADVSGKILASHNNSKSLQVNLAGYAQGLYLVTVENKSGEKTVHKFMKN